MPSAGREDDPGARHCRHEYGAVDPLERDEHCRDQGEAVKPRRANGPFLQTSANTSNVSRNVNGTVSSDELLQTASGPEVASTTSPAASPG